MRFFCWHKWPLYGETIKLGGAFEGMEFTYRANFKCYKCGVIKEKRCDKNKMRIW